MPKKKATTTSDLSHLRKSTQYPAVRSLVGLPIMITGASIIVSGGALVISAFSGEAGVLGGLAMFLLGVITALFGLCVATVSCLFDALFDIADAHIRADRRARDAELRALSRNRPQAS